MTQHASNPTPVSPRDAGVLALAPSRAFPRPARVRRKAEFTQVFEHGKRTAEPLLALHWLADAGVPRMGLAVSRKVDARAVGRNRIKRVLRDVFRHQRPALAGGAYVFVARPAAAKADASTLRATCVRLLKRAGALPQTPVAGTMPPATSLPPDVSAPPQALETGMRIQ